MKYLSPFTETGSQKPFRLILVFLFLFFTGFHNHEIKLSPDLYPGIQSSKHESHESDSKEYCPAHTAQSGMELTEGTCFEFVRLEYIEHIFDYDESLHNLTIPLKNSTRSPPGV